MSSDLAALKEYMQHPPPDGDQDNGPILLGVTWAFTAICTVVVGLKLWTRFKIIGQTGMDDAFTVLALVCIPYLNEPPCTKLITDWQAFPSGIRSAFDRQRASWSRTSWVLLSTTRGTPGDTTCNHLESSGILGVCMAQHIRCHLPEQNSCP